MRTLGTKQCISRDTVRSSGVRNSKADEWVQLLKHGITMSVHMFKDCWGLHGLRSADKQEPALHV